MKLEANEQVRMIYCKIICLRFVARRSVSRGISKTLSAYRAVVSLWLRAGWFL